MRLYRKNFTKDMINQRVRSHTVDRDGIVWDIDETNYIASVRIQGSNVNLKCPYHRVNRHRPDYLKKGACVQIRHKRGLRGYAEIVGPGRAIPSPVTGESQLPVRSSVDAILSGMDLSETNPESMDLIIDSGTFRLDETIYVFTGNLTGIYLMQDPAVLVMGNNPIVMGEGWSTVTISAAPSAGYGRYDLIVVGIDGDADVVTGTPALLTTEPTMPTTPPDHILVDHIFIYGGQTEVDDTMIGKSWTAPIAVEIDHVITGDIDGNGKILYQNGAEITLTITATDQYGQTFNGSYATCTCTLNCEDGEVYGIMTDWRSDYAQAQYGTSLEFKYRRNDPVGIDDDPPIFSIESETGNFGYVIFVMLA